MVPLPVTPVRYWLGVQGPFSIFPNLWPGMGLLILRLAAGFSLLGVGYMTSGLGDVATGLLRCVALAVAVPLLLGFGTPLASVGEAMIQVGIITAISSTRTTDLRKFSS